MCFIAIAYRMSRGTSIQDPPLNTRCYTIHDKPSSVAGCYTYTESKKDIEHDVDCVSRKESNIHSLSHDLPTPFRIRSIDPIPRSQQDNGSESQRPQPSEGLNNV
jgi:hypothetical protein